MTKEEIHFFLDKEANFTFAKTMENIPHSWICRKNFSDNKFLKVMTFIQQNGYSDEFYSREYIYYDIGKYKYWVMTDDDGVDDSTAIINRAKI